MVLRKKNSQMDRSGRRRLTGTTTTARELSSNINYHCRRKQLFLCLSLIFFIFYFFIPLCWKDDINCIHLIATLPAEDRFTSTPAAKQHTSMTKVTLGHNSCWAACCSTKKYGDAALEVCFPENFSA